MTTKKSCVMLSSDARNRMKWEDKYYDKHVLYKKMKIDIITLDIKDI